MCNLYFWAVYKINIYLTLVIYETRLYKKNMRLMEHLIFLIFQTMTFISLEYYVQFVIINHIKIEFFCIRNKLLCFPNTPLYCITYRILHIKFFPSSIVGFKITHTERLVKNCCILLLISVINIVYSKLRWIEWAFNEDQIML